MKILIPSFTILFAMQLSAQVNSITLKDGVGSVISSHGSVTDAYAAIPATLSQAYVIEIESTYDGSLEAFPITFVAKSGASSVNTITLRPAANVTNTAIQSSVSGSPLLAFNDADYMIIDGRPGGTGTSGELTIFNQGTTSGTNTLQFVEGATFNTVRYCTISNGTTGSAGRGVALLSSTANPTGNSDNLFEYCLFNSGRYQFNSNGNTTYPNTRNTVRGCTFENPIFVGIWSQSGTGKMLIDSCTIHSTAPSGSGLFFGILFDAQNDTTVISNNRIYDLQNGSTGTMRYIHIRSTAAGGTNLTHIYNNFLSINAGNTALTNVGAIEYSGSNPTFGRVENNSIYVGGTVASGGTSGNVGSSGILLNNSSASSQLQLSNNLVVSTRSGGTSGLQHTALAVVGTAPQLTMDYNTYTATSGTPVRYDATTYATVAAYQAVVAPNEINSNEEAVSYVSATDLHLTGTSVGNLNLQGSFITEVVTDIDGEPRVLPYRGADEAAVNLCSGTPDAGLTIASDDTLCDGEAFSVYVNGSEFQGLTYQWQESADGTNFTDITGAMDTIYTGTISETSYYQCIVTCTALGLADTADMVVIVMTPNPTGGTIMASSVDYDYSFSVGGLTGTFDYQWSFGDGGTSTLENPDHTYANNGNYAVTVIVSNDCDADTLQYITAVTVGLDELTNGAYLLYPNPTSDQFQVKSAVQGTAHMRIYDLTGRLRATLPVDQFPVTLSAQQLQLTTGMYLVKINTDNHESIHQLMVE